MYSKDHKEKALELRKQGYSINEIVQKLGIAKGTASVWVRSAVLDTAAQRRLKQRCEMGYRNLDRYRTTRKMLRSNRYRLLRKYLKTYVSREAQDKHFLKCLCAFLFWAEGAKSLSVLHFTNSDPQMVKVFMSLLRSVYPIDETKLRVIMHLHEHHSEARTLNFWSKVTNVPKNRFNKTYVKPHTGINKRVGYKGCVRIAYYDAEVLDQVYSSRPVVKLASHLSPKETFRVRALAGLPNLALKQIPGQSGATIRAGI
ncbi:MAG: hypothetical protein UU79_C0007G0002 [candidate division WWE3 bacterium GW2011_GWE1_41_72]|nr:MAG: hypothetical protein UU79_C0007G0002 [candidate division WWE3 bacterium GW2011_GWE1_41_72]